MRLVRSPLLKKQEIVTVNSSEESTFDGIQKTIPPATTVTNLVNESSDKEANVEGQLDASQTDFIHIPSETPLVKNDTLQAEISQSEKVEVALQAEQNASYSFIILLIVAALLIFLFVYPIFTQLLIARVALMLGILAIAVFAFYLAVISKRANYITKKGLKLAHLAIVLSIGTILFVTLGLFLLLL